MNPDEIQAEIDELRRQAEVLQEQIRKRRSALAGPYVQPVLVLNGGEEEPLPWGPFTLEHAFKFMNEADDDYGTYYDPEGVSVGGCLVTTDEWEFDQRNPDRQHWLDRTHEAAVKEQYRLDAEEAERLREVERAKMARITKHGPMVAVFSRGVQVSDWQPQSKGHVTLPEGWSGTIDEVVYTLPGGMLGRVPVTGSPKPGTDITLSDWPLG